MQKQLITITLAAGKGTRMKSAKAKVLHEVFHAPMIHHVLNAQKPLNPRQKIVIVGHQQEAVKTSLDEYEVEFAVQKKQLGTGHAVLAAEEKITEKDGVTMILCGDTPLIEADQLRNMYENHLREKAVLSLMTTRLDNPANYGRIITDDSGELKAIVEEKDAAPKIKMIREINAGIYCVNTDFLFENLKKIGTDNAQGEVYLTDILSLAVSQGKKAVRFNHPDAVHVLGVNSRLELSLAHHELLMRRNRELMAAGVTMYQPETIDIEPGVSIDADCILYPGVTMINGCHIGGNCIIQNNCWLDNVRLENNVTIGSGAYLKNCTLPRNTVIEAHKKITG